MAERFFCISVSILVSVVVLMHPSLAEESVRDKSVEICGVDVSSVIGHQGEQEVETAALAFEQPQRGSSRFEQCFPLELAPNMIGDFFNGYRTGLFGAAAIDRLVVIAPDLDAPVPLPPGGSPLTIIEAGPVGIYSGALNNIQQLQVLLRNGTPLPVLTVEGMIADNATMTTALSISQIQALLASTPEAYDIVPVIAPPASYDTEVANTFAGRNILPGTTVSDATGSGTLLQSGVDTLNGGEDFDAFYFYSYAIPLTALTPGSGFGTVGRLKVATGNSPLPRDRAYFYYGMFSGVPLSTNGVSLDRFTPGFEKTFIDGMVSVEMRFPFAATLENNVSAGPGSVTGSEVEFGNIAVFFKSLLHTTNTWALTGGLGVSLPTADDIQIGLADGTRLVDIDNEAVHLKPFLAALYIPNSRFFAHGFFEIDTDTNGNRIDVYPGSILAAGGRLYDATFLSADLGIGYRIQRSPCAWITAISPTFEVHYNASLEKAENITVGTLGIGSRDRNINALNLTMGATLEVGTSSNVALGYVVPVGDGADQQLDGGLRVMLEYRPGS